MSPNDPLYQGKVPSAYPLHGQQQVCVIKPKFQLSWRCSFSVGRSRCCIRLTALFAQAAAGMSEDQFDVVVVGAGLSGLSAARRLQKKNPQLRVLVLEARGASQEKK